MVFAASPVALALHAPSSHSLLEFPVAASNVNRLVRRSPARQELYAAAIASYHGPEEHGDALRLTRRGIGKKIAQIAKKIAIKVAKAVVVGAASMVGGPAGRKAAKVAVAAAEAGISGAIHHLPKSQIAKNVGKAAVGALAPGGGLLKH